MTAGPWPTTLLWLEPEPGECGYGDCERPAAPGRYLCERCIAELEARAAKLTATASRQVLSRHRGQCYVCGKAGAQQSASTPHGLRPVHEACRGRRGTTPRAAQRDGTGPLRRAPTPASP
jgi:hypothetical protein